MVVLQVYKCSDYNVNLLYCKSQSVALKQDYLHFVFCLKHGNKIEGVVLNRVSVETLSGSPIYTQILAEQPRDSVWFSRVPLMS